jgi:CDP-glucose 4,6-dehydratase
VSGASWAGRSVLVTGHTGFKGAWLSLWLTSLGARVSGLALEAGKPSFFEATGLDGAMSGTLGDIRDQAVVNRAFRDAGPEVVFHMAAQSLVRASYRDPVGTYATNVMGTLHVLEAARGAGGVRALIVVTSDKCYENREWAWGYRERDRLGGHDPYSSSKACAEIATSAYRRSYLEAGAGTGPAVATVRAGNVIGGGDWAEDRLVPDLVRAITAGRKPVLRNPAAVRPWQHVLDPLGGYVTLAERLLDSPSPQLCDAWNFGPREDSARPVDWMTERFLRAWGTAQDWIHDASAQPHEAQQLRLDTAKARQLLGWEPAIELEQAIDDTAHWYRGHAAGAGGRDLALAQINRFMEKTRRGAPTQACQRK